MKQYIPFSGHFTVVILLLGGLISSCIKDNRDNCDTSYKLIVKTVASDSVSQGDIGDVMLFIFDKDQKFMGTMKTQVDQVTELAYPSNDELYVLAWGNINGTHQSISDPMTSKSLPRDIRVQLAVKNNQYTLSPDDLFQGAKLISKITGNSSPEILWINRKVAKITIIAKNLQSYLNTTDQDFTYIVRGSNNALDLTGAPSGDEAHIQPDAAFDQNQEFKTPSFQVFPTQNLAVDIYKADQLVYTIDKDDSGNPFVAPEGKKLTILVDFSGNVRVTISISDWNQTEVENEM